MCGRTPKPADNLTMYRSQHRRQSGQGVVPERPQEQAIEPRQVLSGRMSKDE